MLKNALLEKKASQTWMVRAEVDEMEEWLQQKELMGMVQHTKQGFRWMKHSLWSKACVKERRKMVESKVIGKYEGTYVKAGGQMQQEAWTRWTGMQMRALQWQEIWRMELMVLSFHSGQCMMFFHHQQTSEFGDWAKRRAAFCVDVGERCNML